MPSADWEDHARRQVAVDASASGGDRLGGWLTRADGSHVPLDGATAAALLADIERREAERGAAMPATAAALRVMFEGWDRLLQLGWRLGRHCPKDRTSFAVIEFGSTGIFTGFYLGEWPDGSAFVEDFFVHPDGFLWKPLDQLTGAEEAARQASLADGRAAMDREVRAFSGGGA